MKQGMLYAYAIPIAAAQVGPIVRALGSPRLAVRDVVGWDHTYVISDARDVWPCSSPIGGAYQGGRLIAYGPANIEVSVCFAQPNKKAGIRYLINGVCHQIANRILLPARVLANRANGYNQSAFFFGAYGCAPLVGLGQWEDKDPFWPERKICRDNHAYHPYP